jgi:dTDP-4-dehydrorhamnose 3,5-epimerase-like enzyme
MFQDKRGKIFFPIKNNSFDTKETIVSINNKNVFRGIHVEDFLKLITCVSGKILDIIINFDNEADDYLIPKY